MDLAITNQFESMLRRVIGEELQPLQGRMNQFDAQFKNMNDRFNGIDGRLDDIDLRLDDLSQDVAMVRQAQLSQGMQLRELHNSMRGVKTTTRTNSILLEDLESRFSAGDEAYDR